MNEGGVEELGFLVVGWWHLGCCFHFEEKAREKPAGMKPQRTDQLLNRGDLGTGMHRGGGQKSCIP